MPYIRVRPEGLQRMSEMLDRVEKDIEQREEAFSIVSRNLDWQVKREEDIDWQYVDGKDAVAAVGSDDVQFLDVRDDDTYAQGHLKGSLQCGLKDFESADAQKAMYELAQTMDSSKPVYILCYSGNKCAKTAIAVMKDAGFDTNELFIIKDGAKGKDVAAALVTE